MTLDPNALMLAIRQCVQDLNKQLTAGERLDDSPETILAGEGGKLDSLSLITLLVAIEEAVEKNFAVRVAVLDEEMLGADDGPYRTLGSLARWIAERAA
jgi:acyl carrier protein